MLLTLLQVPCSRPTSKKQFQSKLNQPWVASLHHGTESCSVADVAVRVHKLRVIEQVEEFGAELKLRALADGRVLEQRKVEVVNPGTATDGSRRISDDAELSRLSKARRIKGVMIGTPRIELAKRRRDVWLARRQEGEAVLELEVGIGSDADGEAALKDRNPRNGPAIGELSGGAAELRNRQLP